MENPSLQLGCSLVEMGQKHVVKGAEKQSVGAVLTGFQHW